jgi:hypothetical protein
MAPPPSLMSRLCHKEPAGTDGDPRKLLRMYEDDATRKEPPEGRARLNSLISFGFRWLGELDSNQHWRSQSPNYRVDFAKLFPQPGAKSPITDQWVMLKFPTKSLRNLHLRRGTSIRFSRRRNRADPPRAGPPRLQRRPGRPTPSSPSAAGAISAARILKRGTGLLIKGGGTKITFPVYQRLSGRAPPRSRAAVKTIRGATLRLQNAAKTAIFRAAETFQRPERLGA